MNNTMFLLDISWPAIINANQMDFDFYTLQIDTLDGGVNLVNTTAKTNTTSCMFPASAPANNLTVQITIDAVNRCKNTSTCPLQVNHTLNTGMINIVHSMIIIDRLTS